MDRTETGTGLADLYSQKERANALALNGKHAEFYKCSILSSQDTLGYNGPVSNYAYFNECTIGGNVDYICGAGTMLFDKCTLQWYPQGSTGDVGYIVAPKTSPYIFRDCEVTVSDNSSVTGYYGRTWGNNSYAIFLNTQTNGYINSTGWTKMNSTDSGETFYEYGNTTDGSTSFTASAGTQLSESDTVYDQASDDDVIVNMLDSWVPDYYINSEYALPTEDDEESDTTTVTWDFQNAKTDLGNDTDGTSISGTTGTVTGTSSEYVLTVDATNGKLAQRTSDAQFNSGTIIKVPVQSVGDTVTVVSYPNYYYFTVGGTAATSDTTEYTATADDVTKGYVEIVATDSAYLYSITLVTTTSSTSSSDDLTECVFTYCGEGFNSDSTKLLVYGAIPTDYAEKVSEVGIYFTTDSAVTDFSGISGSNSGSSTTVYDKITFDEEEYYSEDGGYVYGAVLSDLSESIDLSGIYVYTYVVTTGGNTLYSSGTQLQQ
ncbi:MAG: pectinesterase family protein [Clostridiales bacterium]|nr:pectinesterase family protein [Clostridiales bacterium]